MPSRSRPDRPGSLSGDWTFDHSDWWIIDQISRHDSRKFPSKWASSMILPDHLSNPYQPSLSIIIYLCKIFHLWCRWSSQWPTCAQPARFMMLRNGFSVRHALSLSISLSRLSVSNWASYSYLKGISCPANTHKPSFHVNTTNISTTAKHGSTGKANGSVEQPMTEEEFFEWLQSAVQSGAFDAPGEGENPSGGGSSGGGSAMKSNAKKKKKGTRKQRWMANFLVQKGQILKRERGWM